MSNYSKLTISYSVTTSSAGAGHNPTRRLYVMANTTNAFVGDFGTRSDAYEGPPTNVNYSKTYCSGANNVSGWQPQNLDANTSYTQTIDISGWDRHTEDRIVWSMWL